MLFTISQLFPLVFLVINKANGQCKGGTTINLGKQICGEKLIFEDQFNGNDVSTLGRKWKAQVRFADYPDYDFVLYNRTKNNMYLKNGRLHIQPTLISTKAEDNFIYNGEIDLNSYASKPLCSHRPDSGLCRKKAHGFRILPPISSARITSQMRMKYGTVEVQAKLPEGDWIYPQIELVPPTNSLRYGRSAGVIVIALVRGNDELKILDYDPRLNFGNTWLEAGIFAGTYAPKKTPSIIAAFNSSGWNKDFHTFRITWTPGRIDVTVDEKPVGTGFVHTTNLLPPPYPPNAPADEELEIALGVGVGGIQRFPDGILSRGTLKPWKNTSPKAMYHFWEARNSWLPSWKDDKTALIVDHVKVWSLRT